MNINKFTFKDNQNKNHYESDYYKTIIEKNTFTQNEINAIQKAINTNTINKKNGINPKHKPTKRNNKTIHNNTTYRGIYRNILHI